MLVAQNHSHLLATDSRQAPGGAPPAAGPNTYQAGHRGIRGSLKYLLISFYLSDVLQILGQFSRLLMLKAFNFIKKQDEVLSRLTRVQSKHLCYEHLYVIYI